VVAIRLPSLRERREDLLALTDHLLANLSVRHRRSAIQLSDEARRALESYNWPGNVRELLNVLERAVVLSPANLIRVDDLPDRLLAPAPPAAASPPSAAGALSLEAMERIHIQQVLADSATLEEAAARLGINPTTLWRKRKRYGID
jgi:NtrC-family two-component system response regulator AlgB